MEKSKKQEAIAKMSETFASDDVKAVIVTHYQKLSVSDLSKLRTSLREVGASYSVVKNNLVKIASKGTSFEKLIPNFEGPVGLTIANDAVGAAKKLVEFTKENKNLILISAIVDNQFVDQKGIDTLSKLPSLDEIRAKICAIISTPARDIASVISAPGLQVARVINAYSEK